MKTIISLRKNLKKHPKKEAAVNNALLEVTAEKKDSTPASSPALPGRGSARPVVPETAKQEILSTVVRTKKPDVRSKKLQVLVSKDLYDKVIAESESRGLTTSTFVQKVLNALLG